MGLGDVEVLSVDATRAAGRCGCMCAVGRRDRPVGAVDSGLWSDGERAVAGGPPRVGQAGAPGVAQAPVGAAHAMAVRRAQSPRAGGGVAPPQGRQTSRAALVGDTPGRTVEPAAHVARSWAVLAQTAVGAGVRRCRQPTPPGSQTSEALAHSTRPCPVRRGRFRAKTSSSTSAGPARLDIVRGSRRQSAPRWLLRRSPSSRRDWHPLGGAGPLGPLPFAAFNGAVPKARQVADPFHVVRLGNAPRRSATAGPEPELTVSVTQQAAGPAPRRRPLGKRRNSDPLQPSPRNRAAQSIATRIPASPNAPPSD